jgi:hypothetical protein
MDNPKYPSVADDDDDAGNQKGGDKHRRLAAPTILVVENRASLQLWVVAELACNRGFVSVTFSEI